MTRSVENDVSRKRSFWAEKDILAAWSCTALIGRLRVGDGCVLPTARPRRCPPPRGDADVDSALRRSTQCRRINAYQPNGAPMQYLLLIYENEADAAGRGEAGM